MFGLFWSMDGRIGRRAYWSGLAVVVVLAFLAGPLQRMVDHVFDAIGGLHVDWTVGKLSPHVASAGGGDREAQVFVRTTILQHLAERVGLAGLWFAAFIVIALVVLRSLVALVLKRMADAGFSRRAAWSVFLLLLLANLTGPVAWVGAGFHLAFLAAILAIGFLPPRPPGAAEPTRDF